MEKNDREGNTDFSTELPDSVELQDFVQEIAADGDLTEMLNEVRILLPGYKCLRHFSFYCLLAVGSVILFMQKSWYSLRRSYLA